MKIAELPRRRRSDLIVGACAPMKKVLDQISVAAASSRPVFLFGESGTGKELVARTIHGASARAECAFVSLHCAVIPDVLLEGELFGLPQDNPLSRFARGPGLIAEASGGTIFLDQVEAIPPALQTRLLAVLEGSEQLPRMDPGRPPPLLVAASSVSRPERGGKAGPPPDLLESLEGLSITLPPLRERGEDIALLAAHFLRLFAR
ncbi:MAG: sigma 54-interacting transcriptional regulator, partial [Myxococcota bacterium]